MHCACPILARSVARTPRSAADAFKQFIAQSGLAQRIQDRLASLDVEDVSALTAAGGEIRRWVIETPLIPDFDKAVREAYARLCERAGAADIAVAVRSEMFTSTARRCSVRMVQVEP